MNAGNNGEAGARGVVWRVVVEDGTTHEVRVERAVHLAGTFVAYHGTEEDDDHASALARTPRAAFVAVCEAMGWAIRQVLALGELTVTEAWDAGAGAEREAIAGHLDALAEELDGAAAREGDVGMAAAKQAVAAHHRAQAVMMREMGLPRAPLHRPVPRASP